MVRIWGKIMKNRANPRKSLQLKAEDGGEGGIRTPGTLRPSGFQDRTLWVSMSKNKGKMKLVDLWRTLAHTIRVAASRKPPAEALEKHGCKSGSKVG